MKELLIKKLNQLSPGEKTRILSRAEVDFEGMEKNIKSILEKVRLERDSALFELTERFDRCRLDSLLASEREISEAMATADPDLVDTFKHIKRNLEQYYSTEKPQDWYTWVDKGIYSGMIYRPYQRVGVYVPRGKAMYPTIVLRICVPALVAGVPELVICSPPDRDGRAAPGVLITAGILGINEVYKIGGAQAVAAMAYGTETVAPVQKIAAVGSAYVIAAQKFLFGKVNIDKLAGPSDGLVFADESAKPELVAANMLVETEHGPTSGTPVLVPSMEFAREVGKHVERLIEDASEMSRKIFDTALYDYSAVLVYDDQDEALDFVNEYGPEHLQLTVHDPRQIIDRLINVGAVQVGEYSVISSGDFFGGTANVLPTGGMASMFSDITASDFLKKIPVQYFSEEGFRSVCDQAERLARYQGMPYHARAIKVRKEL